MMSALADVEKSSPKTAITTAMKCFFIWNLPCSEFSFKEFNGNFWKNFAILRNLNAKIYIVVI
jgi:hypothetical protein